MSTAFVDNEGKLNWRKIGYHARSAFAVFLSLVVLIGGGWFVYNKIETAWVAWRTVDDYNGEGLDPVTVLIPRGATITQVGDILVENKVVKSIRTFRQEAQKNPKWSSLQAGRYKLKTELPAAIAVSMLLDSANLEVKKVTITEGLRLSQQFEQINKATGIPVAKLQEAIKTVKLSLPIWSKGNREGFMFPDTYQLSEPVDPNQLYNAQVAQFNKVAKDIELDAKAKELKITPLQLLTVASIIEREAARAQDRANVASVIYNRLAKKRKLQLDSTVHFAVNATNRITTTEQDRKVDSPYNTYKYAGLPPGAISNPGKAALVAAANPAQTDYMFFTTINLDTGETRFAVTEEEHLENVKLFQAWCQANKGRCT